MQRKGDVKTISWIGPANNGHLCDHHRWMHPNPQRSVAPSQKSSQKLLLTRSLTARERSHV